MSERQICRNTLVIFLVMLFFFNPAGAQLGLIIILNWSGYPSRPLISKSIIIKGRSGLQDERLKLPKLFMAR